MKHAIKILEGSFAALEETNKFGLFPADHEIPVGKIRHSIRKALILLKRYEKKSPSAKNSLEALIVEAEAVIGRFDEIREWSSEKGIPEPPDPRKIIERIRGNEANEAEASVGQEEEVAEALRRAEATARTYPDVPLLRDVDCDGGDGGLAPHERKKDAGRDA